MVKVKIECLTDYNDCETCGGGFEDGGRIWIDGVLVWEKVPHAGCYDNTCYSVGDLMTIAMEKLGIEVEVI